MPEIKKHLRDVYRTYPAEMPRSGRLRLDMNEGVHGLPRNFVRSVRAGISAELLSTYPAHAELIKKIARHNGIRPENICLGNGSDSVIKYIFETYISPNDKVLLTDPTFAMYSVYCRIFDARPVTVEYRPDLSFPLNTFMDKLGKGIKMAVVVNPNNPTGDAIDPKDLAAIIRKAAKNDILIIVDEAYFYYYPGTVIKMIKKYENLIILRTFSKLCALASARIGYAAASPRIVQSLKRVRPSFDVDGIAALFASELLNRPKIIKSMIEKSKEGAEYLSGMLKAASIEHVSGKANFILIRCGDSVDYVMKKLVRRGIMVSGNFRQPFLKEYMRVTIGDKSQMKLFWKEFIAIWKAARKYEI